MFNPVVRDVELWKVAVSAQDAHVIGALEGSRFANSLLAHASLHLADGLIFMFLHPVGDGREDVRNASVAVFENFRCNHGDAGPGHH